MLHDAADIATPSRPSPTPAPGWARGTTRSGCSALSTARTSSSASTEAATTGRTTDGAAEHVEALAQRYLGGPYPWFGGRDQQRVVLTIAADKVNTMG